MFRPVAASTLFLGLITSFPAASVECSSPVVVDQSFVSDGTSPFIVPINENFDSVFQFSFFGSTGYLVGVSVDIVGYYDTLPRLSIYWMVGASQFWPLLASVTLDSPTVTIDEVIDLSDLHIRVDGGSYGLAVDFPGVPRGPGLAQGHWIGSATANYPFGNPFVSRFISGDNGPIQVFSLGQIADTADLNFKKYVKAPGFDTLLFEVAGVGPGKSLSNEVLLAKTYCESGDDYIPLSCSVLDTFVKHVKAQTDKKIPRGKAEHLTSDAENIKVAIGCI